MLQLTQSHNVSLILSFMKGNGIVRRLLGGYPDSGVDVAVTVNESKDVFLVAYDGEKPVGFISFRPEADRVFSIHLCLKTVGLKTRIAMRKALDFAKDRLFASRILAHYPRSYRAVTKLLDEFGFQEEPDWMLTPVPYCFRSLTL